MELARKLESQTFEFSRTLDAKEEEIDKYSVDLDEVKERLKVLQNQHKIPAKSEESNTSNLISEIALLRNMLAEAQQTKEVALRQQKINIRLKDEMSTELESTRKELEQRISDVQELSVGLKQAIEDRNSLELELRDQEKALRSFQQQTLQKIRHVEKYKGATASQLGESLEKNEMLIEVNEKLQATVQRLQKERDEALRFPGGVSEVNVVPLQQQEIEKAVDPLQDLRFEKENFWGERQAFEKEKRELQEQAVRTKQLLESLVKVKSGESISLALGTDSGDESTPGKIVRPTVNDRTTQSLRVRAEEIAACMALNMRLPFNDSVEARQEEEETISTLRRKVKVLENALVFRGEGR